MSYTKCIIMKLKYMCKGDDLGTSEIRLYFMSVDVLRLSVGRCWIYEWKEEVLLPFESRSWMLDSSPV